MKNVMIKIAVKGLKKASSRRELSAAYADLFSCADSTVFGQDYVDYILARIVEIDDERISLSALQAQARNIACVVEIMTKKAA